MISTLLEFSFNYVQQFVVCCFAFNVVMFALAFLLICTTEIATRFISNFSREINYLECITSIFICKYV